MERVYQLREKGEGFTLNPNTFEKTERSVMKKVNEYLINYNGVDYLGEHVNEEGAHLPPVNKFKFGTAEIDIVGNWLEGGREVRITVDTPLDFLAIEPILEKIPGVELRMEAS